MWIIIFVLGIVVGVALSLLVLMIVERNKQVIGRTLDQVVSKSKKKGEIFEPDPSELENFISSLPKE